MDIVLSHQTAISPVWQQDFGNPGCWYWEWARRRHRNQFKYLDLLYRNQQEEEKKEAQATAAEAKKAGNNGGKQNSSGSKKNKDLKRVRKAINAIIEKFSDEEGWLSSGQLGDQLGKRLPDFDVRNYGYSKLTPFIKSLGNYEVGRIPTGSGGRKQIYFRIREEQ